MILFGTKNWKVELIFHRENPSQVYANEQSFVSIYKLFMVMIFYCFWPNEY